MKKQLSIITFIILTFSQFEVNAGTSKSNYFIDSKINDSEIIIEKSNQNNQENSVYQLVTHGKPGELFIGNHWMKKEEILKFLQNHILKNTTHINIYGCEFGKGSKGKDAIAYLEKHLNVSIAASTNITGKNGDWNLEYGKNRAVLNIANYSYSLQAEICSDGIDNDNDGYIDSFDTDCSPVPSCTIPSSINPFSIVKKRFTSANNATSLTPVVGDLDGDGHTEIIVAELASPYTYDAGTTAKSQGYRIFRGDGSDFNDNTIDIPLLTTPEIARQAPIIIPALADVNRDGKAEIIIVGADRKIHIYNYSSATNSTTQTMVSTEDAAQLASPKVADINEDGIPEVIIGNSIFTFNPGYTAIRRIRAEDTTIPEGKAGLPWDMDPVVMDILPNFAGKEFIAGSRVYSLDFTTGNLILRKDLNAFNSGITAGQDGRTAVADMDLDGDLDIVYTTIMGTGASSVVHVLIWDPNQNILLMRVLLPIGYAPTNLGNGRIGTPFIANVYNDITNNGRPKNLPELVFITRDHVYAYNLYDNVNYLWRFSHLDPSGSTTLNAFDFNGDGVVEMVYRDENELRIINGNVNPPVNLTTFTSRSETWVENSVIADVDDDGEAEMVIVSGTGIDTSVPVSAANPTGIRPNRDTGSLEVFESDEFTTWVGARNVWNQRGYHVTNINDDLTVPIKEQNSLAQFPVGSGNQPLNSYLAQVPPNPHVIPGRIAVPDLLIAKNVFDANTAAGNNCPTYTMTSTINNIGSADVSTLLYFNIYKSDPKTPGAVLLTQISNTINIPAKGTQNIVQSFTLPISAYPLSNVYIVINTNPNMTVPIDNADFESSYPECDFTNNIVSLNLPNCKDSDGDSFLNFTDLDDDNDGILDAVESPSCFYTLAEANTVSKITSGLTSPQDNQADGDIQILHDGALSSVASNFSFSAGQATIGAEYFRIAYPTQVKLSTVSILNNTTFGTGTTAKLQASNDGNLWTDVSSNVSLDTAVNKVFSSTATSKYFYYRIVATNTTAVSTISTTTIFEITSVIAADYKPSANPKATCTMDPDGDTLNNHLDLDSDNDTCFDAIEGDENAILTQLNANGSINTTVDTEGVPLLVNTSGSADIGADQGQGLGDSQNAGINACITYCFKPGITSATAGLQSLTAVSEFSGLAADPKYWLSNMPKNGALVIGSHTKGFVITRIASPQNVITGANAIKGMLVFDTDANCLKMYDGTEWFCLTQKCVD